MKAGSSPSSEGHTLREMGRIVKPHGVMGELKVAPETDDPGRFQLLETIFVGADEASTSSFDILSVRLQPSRFGITVLLKLEGINSREAAESLNKLRVFASQDDLPQLDEGEYYLSDLIGLPVETVAGEVVGTVADVYDGAGHDLLVIQRTGGGKAMVPLVPEIVPKIDIDQAIIRIDPVDGLL